jgi:hypothetical protein
MPFEFHVRGRNSADEAAAVQTAFTNLITALHGAIEYRVAVWSGCRQ